MLKKEGTVKIPAALAIGALLGLIITVIGATITTSMIHAQTISEDVVGISAMVIILLGSVTTSLATVTRIRKMRFVMSLSGAGVYFLCLLCIAAILFDGVKVGVFSTAVLATAGGLTVFLLGMNGGRRQKYKVPKFHG